MKYTYTATTGLLCLALIQSGKTHAEEQKANQLSPLLVTASHTPILQQETGSSVTIIDSEQIQRRQSVLVADLLREVPGIAVNQAGGSGAARQIRLRGNEANQTLILIDGIEANDSALGSEFDFAHLLAADIERIEIIRGPQSSLWGSDALAGVINIITRSSGEKGQLSGSGELGSFGTARGSLSLTDRADNYHYAINTNLLRSDGTNVAEQGDEKDGYSNMTFNFKAGITPLDNLELTMVARHTETEKEFDPTSFITSRPEDGDRETHNAQTYGLLQARLDLFNGRWQHIARSSFTGTDNDNFTDGLESSSTQGQKLKFDYQTSVFLETPTIMDASHTITFGLESEREQFDQTGTATAFGDPNQSQEQTNYGFIGEYRLGLLERLFFSTSVRHDVNDDFDDATTYRGSLAYHLHNTGTTLRGNYGTGVKNPTFSDLFGFAPDTFTGNPGLAPERSKGWEIGVDQKLLNDQVQVSLTWFKSRLEDEINGFAFDPGLGGFTAVNLDGKSEREGLELAVQANLSASLSVNGAYTYVNATEPDTTNIQIREIRRPQHIASASIHYLFMGDKADINLGMDYNGSQNDSDFSTFPSTLVKLGSYLLVNLSGSYQLNNHALLFGRIENLLDEDYQDIVGFNTPGIAAYAGVRFVLDL